jgi:hypothetical protein
MGPVQQAAAEGGAASPAAGLKARSLPPQSKPAPSPSTLAHVGLESPTQQRATDAGRLATASPP